MDVYINNDETYGMTTEDGVGVEIGFPDMETGDGATLTLFAATEHVKVRLTNHERFCLVNALALTKDDDTLEQIIFDSLADAREKADRINVKMVRDNDE